MPNFRKLFPIIVSSFFAVLVMVSYVSAQSLDTELSSDESVVHVGDTVQVHLRVFPPSDSEPIYTVSATTLYDTELLSYQSSRFATINWFPLNRAPYILEDTAQGMIRKTAGYPAGLRTGSDFLIYTFTAINPGIATVSIEDGLALHEDNAETSVAPRKIFIRILPRENIVVATTTATATIDTQPVQNKVVKVDLSINGDTAFYYQDDYTMSVAQPNVSTASTTGLISTTYVEIYNNDFKTVWKKDLTYPIGGEDIVFNIPAFTLKPGNYVISVKSLLSSGEVLILDEKYVGVLDKNLGAFGKYRELAYAIMFFVVCAAVLHHLMMDEDRIAEDGFLKKRIKAILRKKK